MLSQVLNVSKSAFVGLGLFNSYRCSRSFAVGWKEQRLLCTWDAIGSLALLVIAAQDNLKFMGGDKLYNSVNRASYLRYVAIPALHVATNKLEHSEHKVAKKIAELSYLHMSDAVMVATAVHSLAALSYGFNKVSNACLLANVVWAYAEQGVFWDEPEEDCGPLFKYNKGNIVRTYEPVVSYLNLTVGIPFYFLYKGWPGKFTAVMSCICRFVPLNRIEAVMACICPSATLDMIPKAEVMIPEAEVKIAPKPMTPQVDWVVGKDVPALFTQKHFEVFKVEDCFPDKTLKGLEKELQQKLTDDTDTSLQEFGFIGVEKLTKRQMLEHLLGVKGKLGHLNQHTIASRDVNEKDKKTVELKNIFGFLLADWDGRKSRLIDRFGECLCRTATAGMISDLCLEIYDDIALKARDKTTILDKKIALILQQSRDIKFYQTIQGFILLIKQLKKKKQQEADERSERLYQAISGWEVTRAQWWRDFGRYSMNWTEETGKELLISFMYGLATSRHQVNLTTVLVGGPMGLSYYDEAYRDMRMQLAKQMQDITVYDKIAKFYEPIYVRDMQLNYLTGVGLPDGGAHEELINVIVSCTDTRLDFDAIRSYLHEKEGQNHLSDELMKVEQLKPICKQAEQFENWFDENQLYEKAKKRFLEKYMPQVLYELGYTTY